MLTLLMARGTEIGPEVDDKALLDFPVEVLDVVVTNRAFVGKTFRELAAMELARGVFLRSLVRLGQAMPVHLRHPHRPRRRPEPHRRQARRRAGGEGARVRRPADRHDRHDLRRRGHLPRRAGRPALGDDRRAAHHAHREWRSPDHGAGVRLAARCAPDLRPHPRSRHVGVRHRGADRVHRRGGARRRSQLRLGAAELRGEPDPRGPRRRRAAPHAGDPVRLLCPEDESR